LLRYAARQRHVTLEADLAPALAPMLADASQLQQVLINLVVNAVEATPAGGRVTVRATPQVRAGITGVTLAVVDTGSGIAPEHLPRLFEPFFTTRPRGQGTGLGLAISREIVRAHRGEIDVETSLGEGTTMTAWIPAAPDGA
jgi:signal transduction histidine kinase